MRKEIFDRDNVAVQGREKQVGGLPEGWRDSTWGDEISLEYGKALRSYEGVQGAVRVFGSNGPIGWTDTALAEGPGIILGRKGAYRGVKFSKKPFFVIDTAYYVKPKSALDMRWLYYAIVHHKLGEIDDGSPIPSTTRSAVYVRDVEIPPLPEQKAIAAILGALDDKIEANRKMNATLEGIARVLFKSWFVDFDPVRSKAEGRPSGLPVDLDALFPGGFADSPLGEIPAGWECGTLNDFANLQNGYAFKGSDFTTDGVPVVKIGSVKPKFVDLQNTSFVSEKVAEEAKKWRLSHGDILIGMTGYVGEVGRVPITSNPPMLNQRVGKIAPLFDNVYCYLYALCRSEVFKEFCISMAQGSAQPNLSATQILSFQINLPSKNVLSAFEDAIKFCMDKMMLNQHQNQTLATLRDTLLPKLISGQIRVGDVEKLVETIK